MASIEELKGVVTGGRGFALTNQYIVVMPDIPGTNLSARERNVLCRVARLPGRQILTHDRSIGLMNQKIAYGYANAEVGLSFHVLNDFKTKNYFDTWQNLIVDQENQQIQYADRYKKSVKIYQLGKGAKFSIYDRTFNFNVFGVGLQANLNVDFNSSALINYGVELEGAFPVTLNGIDLNDQEASAPMEVSIDLSYKNWKRIR